MAAQRVCTRLGWDHKSKAPGSRLRGRAQERLSFPFFHFSDLERAWLWPQRALGLHPQATAPCHQLCGLGQVPLPL